MPQKARRSLVLLRLARLVLGFALVGVGAAGRVASFFADLVPGIVLGRDLLRRAIGGSVVAGVLVGGPGEAPVSRRALMGLGGDGELVGGLVLVLRGEVVPECRQAIELGGAGLVAGVGHLLVVVRGFLLGLGDALKRVS